MSQREPEALWVQALEGPDTDRLADEIVAVAVAWAGGDLARLKEAEEILARSRSLGGEEEPCPNSE